MASDRRRFDRFMDHTILNEVTLDVSNDPTRVLALECIAEDLYNVIEGWRVFTLVATPPARPDATAVPRLLKPSQSGTAEPPTQSDPPRRQGLIPQKPYSKRAKLTYEVR